MAEIIDKVTDLVASETKKMSKVSKEDYKENLGMVMGQLSNFVTTINNVQGSDRDAFTKKILAGATTKDNAFCAAYVQIAKAIGDNKPAFATFSTCAKNMETVLKMLERNTNLIFHEKVATIYNIKMSQASALIMVNMAQLFVNYAIYLFDGILYELVVNEGEHELEKPRPYRYEFITKNQNAVIEVLKVGGLPQGANLLITELDRIRKSVDPMLLDNSNQVNKDLVAYKTNVNIFKSGLFLLAKIFRYFGEYGVVYRNLQYQKMLQEKEWLQNHNDLLKLQLAGANPNSDEYRKAVKIIDTYNNMIADLDVQINNYLAD